jgi:hypothetical protein
MSSTKDKALAMTKKAFAVRLSKSKKLMYRYACAWIAANDEPSCSSVKETEKQITVLLVADIFNMATEDVAFDVVSLRLNDVELRVGDV